MRSAYPCASEGKGDKVGVGFYVLVNPIDYRPADSVLTFTLDEPSLERHVRRPPPLRIGMLTCWQVRAQGTLGELPRNPPVGCTRKTLVA